MKQILDEKELIVLQCIASSKTPIGSWFLVEKLEEKGIQISSATIGRILNRLEKLGYLEKESSKGRIIKPEGLEALERAKIIQNINYHKKELDRLISTEVLESYIMVLQARKAIERETARFAAQNITDVEIEYLGDILKKQDEMHERNQSVAETDIAFHKAIAKASRNKVLESLYNILSTLGQQSTLFEYMRAKVKPTYGVSHKEIFEAIKKHDEDEAERCMIRHIENLIKDVSIYWDEYSDKGIKLRDWSADNEG